MDGRTKEERRSMTTSKHDAKTRPKARAARTTDETEAEEATRQDRKRSYAPRLDFVRGGGEGTSSSSLSSS